MVGIGPFHAAEVGNPLQLVGVLIVLLALNVLTIVSLVSERREAQESDRFKSMFLASASHDLRTPLNAIIGFSEMMKNERLGPMGTDRYKEYANDIYSSGTMLLDMIEDLLGIAEAEMDQIELTDEICNLAQLAEIAVASQRQHAVSEGVTIEVDCPERLPGLRGDAKRLRQGLFRLIAEADHCAHRGSTVRLTLREERGGIAVTLAERRDRSAEQNALPWIEEMDDPFVSAEDSGAPREESLALSLTRKVMELHGGSLGVVRGEQASDSGMEISLRFPPERVIR